MRRTLVPALALLLCALAMACAKPAQVSVTPQPPPPQSAAPTPDPTPVYTPAPLPTPLRFPLKGYCNGEGVNLRAQPGTDSAIVDIMGENAVVDVVSAQNDWYRLNLGGTTAYVSRQLITLGEPPRKDNMRWGMVAPETLMLYIAPSDAEHSDATLKQGEVVRILREINGYLHIVYRSAGTVGQRYCHIDGLTPIAAAQAVPLWYEAAAQSPQPESE